METEIKPYTNPDEIFKQLTFSEGEPENSGWRKPSDEDYENLETTRGASTVDVDRLMSIPPRDTYLWTYLHLALQRLHNDPVYVWKPQYQKFGTCFPADTPILMADGTEKFIQDVAVGDLVISHTGNVRRVLQTGKRDYSGTMVDFKLRGWPFHLKLTSEHPVAVYPDISQRADSYFPGNLEWVSACDLELGDRVLMPFFKGIEKEQVVDLNNFVQTGDVVRVYKEATLGVDFVRCKNGRNKIPRYLTVDSRFARLMGLYLAEGCCEKSRVTFTFGGDEELLAHETKALLFSIFGVVATAGRVGSTVYRVRCNDTTVAQFFTGFCPGKAVSKRVPVVFFQSPQEVKLALIRGWLDGDGHEKIRENRLSVVGVTASEMMNRDFHRLSMMCGIKPSSTVRKQEKHQTVASTVLEFCGHEASNVAGLLYSGRKNDSRYYRRTDLGFACRLADMSTYQDELDVYNLEVEEDHSYVANGIAVHNCVGQSSKLAVDILMAINSILYGLEFKGRAAVAGSYTFSRVEIGKEPGKWEGSNGVNAAAAFLKYGVLLLKDLGLPDDSTDADENLAMKWTASRQGVPQNYEDMAQNLLVQDVIAPKSVEMAAKLIQAGSPQFVGTSYLPTGKRDSDGLSKCQRIRGGHEMCIDGVRYKNGVPFAFHDQNSWSADWASGPVYPSDMPPGSVWISAKDYGIMMADGDVSSIIGVNGLKYNG